MAKNAAWRGSLDSWRKRVRHWISRSSPTDLLSVDIFFDLRGVHGDIALANELWRGGFESAAGNIPFAKLLAEAAGEVPRAHDWFGRLRTAGGRIDLKKAGLFGIVSTARALAIRHHVTERATAARLAGITALGLGSPTDLNALAAAQETFLDLVLRQQVNDVVNGVPPSNRVELGRLSRRERARLDDALEAVAHLNDLRRDLLY